MIRAQKAMLGVAVLAVALWAGWITNSALSPPEPEAARGFTDLGGGFVPPTVIGGGGSGGLTAVYRDDPFTGSGTNASHLALALTTSGPVSGTGSAGSPLTSSGDISGVIAGTGLSGGATSGDATLNVNLTTTSCSAGQAETATAANGTSTCSTFVDTAGTSLALSGHTLNVSIAATTCSAGQAETATAADGTSTCSTFIDTAGTSLTKSGHTLSVALPGGTCTAGKKVTAIAADGTATCADTIPNDYSGTHLDWTDEFMFANCGGTNQSLTNCGSIWSVLGVGTASQVTSTGTTTRPGILQLTTGTASTGRTGIETSPTAVDFGQGNWTFEWTGGWETVSDIGSPTDAYSAFLGFGDTDTSINIVDGCGFLYDTQNVATSGANSGKTQALQCECASGSTHTNYLINGSGNSDESFALGTVTVAALTLPSTNILSLKLVMTAATRAEFFTCTTPSSCTKVCDINTHIPSGASNLTGVQIKQVKGTGTTARTMDIDRTRVSVDLTSARSP